MKTKKIIAGIFVLILFCSNLKSSEIVRTDCINQQGFTLVGKSSSATIYFDASEAEVVKISANLLAKDIELVTGTKPDTNSTTTLLSEHSIVIGTIGKSKIIDELSDSGLIDTDSILGKWESYLIKTIKNPVDTGSKILVIAGSDRRGTAYGAFELSKAIGVSPWYWWADITPKHQDSLSICPVDYISKEPTVKYRGIFINDEDWGLQEWAEYTYDPVNDIGPKTYEQVFELLLRLKANYIWPAMHPCTEPFNHYAENKIVADRYAILMGSSHHEPLLYNTAEWPYDKSQWNPFTNMEGVMTELEKRVASNGIYENIYTVGIRGTGDGSVAGGSSLNDKTAKLEEVIDRQRGLLKEYVDTNITNVPQVFWPYKEVMDQYNNNMELPEDITLGWVDDNHGYIRQVSNPTEQARSGGSGVYYHVSYWGSPADYLWITSTQPALIATEMKKAADFGGDRIWIFNVGDIKPAEMIMNFCLDLAWDYNKWGSHNVKEYISNWATFSFGENYAVPITNAYMKYFQLAQAAKPEHINRVNFSDKEIDERLMAYAEIANTIESVYGSIPEELKDAFFETIYYPIIGAGLMNQKFLYAYKSFRGSVINDPEALTYSQMAKDAHNKIQEITAHYNTGIKGGKWDKIISSDIRSQNVYDMPAVATQADVDKEYIELADINLASGTFVAPMKYVNGLVFGSKSGAQSATSGGKAEFTFELEKAIYAEVYFYAKTPTPEEDSWFITVNGSQIIQNDYATGDNFEWIKVKSQSLKAGKNTIVINQREPNAQIAAIKITEPGLLKYAESYIQIADTIIPAWKFSTKQDANGFTWEVTEGLSTSEKAVINMPYTIASVSKVSEAPYIEQDVALQKNSFTLELRCMPTRRLYEGRDLRIGISIDGNTPIVKSIQHPYPTNVWEKNVLQGFTSVSLNYTDDDSLVNIKLYALDPGVIIDKALFYYHDDLKENNDTTSHNPQNINTPLNSVELIYPNPCDDVVNCKFARGTQGTYQVEISDFVGRTIKKEVFELQTKNMVSIQTSELEKGNYIFKISSPDMVKSYIIEKL